MNVGIIAHNSKKALIEDFCIAYKNILAKHEIYATGTTGRRIEEAANLHVQISFCRAAWEATSSLQR